MRSRPRSSKRDGDDRRAEDHNQAGRVMGPDEQRQPEPGHPRRAHRVDRDDEVQTGQDRRETSDENADDRGHDVRSSSTVLLNGV